MKSLRPLMLDKNPLTGMEYETSIDPDLTIGKFESFEQFREVYSILRNANESMFRGLDEYNLANWKSWPSFGCVYSEWAGVYHSANITAEEFIERYQESFR